MKTRADLTREITEHLEQSEVSDDVDSCIIATRFVDGNSRLIDVGLTTKRSLNHEEQFRLLLGDILEYGRINGYLKGNKMGRFGLPNTKGN